jgi:2-amino-4-hydroxy-6-hydroxymethyldihydropteridine diphosphokinase
MFMLNPSFTSKTAPAAMNTEAQHEAVLLSLGANLGEREETLHRAFQMLTESGTLHKARISSLYETAPVGYTEQPAFLNCAMWGVTNLSPEELFRACKQIEHVLGRKPRPRWHEREIDIDIVLFGSRQISDECLTIPHPQMQHRRFVLVPACEIVPSMTHPTLHHSVLELLHLCSDTTLVQPYLANAIKH